MGNLFSSTAAPLLRNRTLRECNIVDDTVVTAILSSQVTVSGSIFGKAFAAVTGAGSLITWGDPGLRLQGGVKEQLTSGVQQVAGTYGAFAALKSAGSVITWGDRGYGADCTGVKEQLAS